jgi:hypothetical protein
MQVVAVELVTKFLRAVGIDSEMGTRKTSHKTMLLGRNLQSLILIALEATHLEAVHVALIVLGASPAHIFYRFKNDMLFNTSHADSCVYASAFNMCGNNRGAFVSSKGP